MTGCAHPKAKLSPLFAAQDYVSGEAFEVCRCDGCGLTVTSPPPAPDAMPRYYSPGYYRGTSARRFPAPVEWGQRLLYGRRARVVERLAGRKPGRVLDVGCGPGYLLEAFRRRGWEAQGTELSDESAAHAREALGLPVHVGPLESWPWPKRHFDAVVLWHSLEHWREPRRALDRLQELVRPGGVVMVGVPNFGSLEARLTKSGWFHLDVPRHLSHLTPASLTAALKAAGFTVRKASFFAPEYDLFSFIQSAENRLGLEQNLLYDLLRRRSAKVLRQPVRLPERALALALAVPLGVVGLPVTTFLGLLGQGSSMTLHAEKRT